MMQSVSTNDICITANIQTKGQISHSDLLADLEFLKK